MTSAASSSRQNGVSNAGQSTNHHAAPRDEVVVTDKVKMRSKSSDKRIINQYEFEQCLGKGQHGSVWVARNVKSNEKMAIKMLKRKDKKQEKLNALRKRNIPSSPHVPLVDRLSETELKILKEIAIMKKLRHPHVVRLLEVIDDHLVKDIYLVMEYCGGGEIKWRTTDNKPTLRVSQTRRIIRDVILGLEYLHYQGIIHRDIKPANLLWSEDRRSVKIADFGVSAFSMAQRIAATGQRATDKDEDPILMNDTDLSKFAGTPMFLAPEIVAEPPAEVSRNASIATTTEANVPRKRAPITKAIDIWALGVTIYCLLFGDLPFKGEHEFSIYRSIREDGWDVPETMGSDEIPTGGRHQPKPKKGLETEGYLVINLLEGLLQKDPKKRFTLEQTKKHPWILRDLSTPDVWLRTTRISNTVGASDAEASSALSFVRFRWTVDFARTLVGALRGVRTQRSLRHSIKDNHRDRDKSKTRTRDDVGTRSMPVVPLPRRKSVAIGAHERETEKRRDEMRAAAHSSLVDVSAGAWRHSSHYSKSSEPVASGSGGTGSGLDVEGSGLKPRRGSVQGHGSSKIDMLNVPTPSSRVASPQPKPALSRQLSKSPTIMSPSSSSSPDAIDEPSRSRFSLTPGGIYRWVTGRSGTPSPQDTVASALPSGAISPATASSVTQVERRASVNRDLTVRRSEDAFHHASSRKSSSSSGPLTLAMRAASWGEVGMYRPSEDVHSMYSGERIDETLDDETRFVGAGGYAQSPVPSLPSAMLSTVSSTASISQPAYNAAQVLLQRVEATASSGPSSLSDGRHRSHATSPLAQSPRSPFGRSRSQLSQSSMDTYSSASGERTPSEANYAPVKQQSVSQLYQAEDESDDDDDDSVPLEVRTRRLSASATSVSPSPPRRPSRDRGRERERPTLCI